METEANTQDVSDADLGAALREFRQHFPLQASAAWHYATERAKDMNVARGLQQAQVVGEEDFDSIALGAAREIADMWGHDRSQLVSKIQVRVLVSMTRAVHVVRATNYHDAYQGARDDLLEWKRRALEAERSLTRLCDQINAENGPTHMGEPQLATPQSSAPVVDEVATRIVRGCCESEPADPEHYDTLFISVETLRDIIESALTGRG